MATCVIFGGRDFDRQDVVDATMDGLHAWIKITRVIEGGATGADRCGRRWAQSRGVPFETVEADWDNVSAPGAVVRHRRDGTPYNAAAGPMRNQKIVDTTWPDFGVEFPGGDGTADMAARLRKAGLEVIPVKVRTVQ